MAGWVILAIGAASILAGVLYTGGPRPYGYEGLGEVFVFLFFGIVAVTGSYYVQVEELHLGGVRAGRARSGCLAAAILVVNNVRDIATDTRAGKRTLAVRLGRAKARTLFGLLVYGAFAGADRRPRSSARGCCSGGWPRRSRVPLGAHGARAHRRPDAQRRAGPDRAAPARVLRAGRRPAAHRARLTPGTVLSLRSARAGRWRGVGSGSLKGEQSLARPPAAAGPRA